MATKLHEAIKLINQIRGALGTEETDQALVEVARNAHRAEQELAQLIRRVDYNEMTVQQAYEKLSANKQ